jgi:hypothetical protein
VRGPVGHLTFRRFLNRLEWRSRNANLKHRARDIAEHGADCGFPCVTYTACLILRQSLLYRALGEASSFISQDP